MDAKWKRILAFSSDGLGMILTAKAMPSVASWKMCDAFALPMESAVLLKNRPSRSILRLSIFNVELSSEMTGY